MTDPEDHFDPLSSLRPGAIAPMTPPEGAHQAVLRRASRRRARTAASVTGAVAAVVAVVVAVPLLTLGGGGGREQVADVLTTTAAAPTTAAPPPSSTSVAPTPAPAPSSAPATTSPPPFTDDGQATGPVPAGYKPESVTFVSENEGWTLGQAQAPCATATCTSVTRTTNGGKSWVGTAAPRAGRIQGTSGVDELRFGDSTDGWAFGGELWSTHNGTSWNPVALPANTAVVSLAANNNRVVAAYARCGAGNCTQTVLRAANTTGDKFTVLPGDSTMPGKAQLAMQAGTVWATSVTNGTVHLVRGAADGSQPVQVLNNPCGPGTANSRVAAGTSTDVALACQQQAGGPIQIYRSTNGGKQWGGGFSLDLPGAQQPGSLSSLALSPAGVLLVANDAGALLRVPAGSTTGQDKLSGGLRFVGWTSSTQAVAVPITPSPGLLYITRNGGNDWTQLQVKS